MNNAYLAIIEKYQAKCIKKFLLNDMLYVTARDSECSNLLIEMLEHPEKKLEKNVSEEKKFQKTFII